MKRVLRCILSMTLLLSACGNRTDPQSGQNAPTWQEQYDLGIRYLSEGNYEEAIIAFTAAIEIDPKRAEAYVGRGDAYVVSGETEENLAAAQADYEMAIELDGTNVDAYLGLADVYIRKGEYDKAKEILEVGTSTCENGEELHSKLGEIEILLKGEYADYYTADLMRPEEMTISGVPFWQASLSTIETLYPGGFTIPADGNLWSQYCARFFAPNGGEYRCCHAGYGEDGNLKMVSYNAYLRDGVNGFVTELRDIQCGENISDVLLKLGFTEKAADEIRVASNTFIHINVDGQLTSFECKYENDGRQRLDAYFDTASESIQLSFSFIDNLIEEIYYRIH